MSRARIPVRPVVAVAGAPGTGTTTLCRALAARLSLPHVYAGAIFRAMAAERGMDLAEFGAYAETHPEVDRDLDERLIAVARAGGVVLEGRMSAWHVGKAGVPGLKVLLVASPRVRAERVAAREGKPVEVIARENELREASETKRYLAFYGFDPNDPSRYDTVIDTGPLTPEAIQDAVLAELGDVVAR